MKKSIKVIIIMVCSVALLASCATPVQVQHPGIDAVKKIAVVSVTSNVEITDIDAKQGDSKADLGALLGAVVAKTVMPDITAEQIQIVTHGDQKIGAMFAGLNGWTLLSESTVIGNADYKALFTSTTGDKAQNTLLAGLQSIGTAEWAVPAGMQTITLETVVPTTNNYVNGERSNAATLRKLGALCTKLGVDAVAVAEVKLSYKTTLLSGMGGSGLFAAVRGSSRPVVEINIAVVNAKSELVMNSNRGWKTFEGSEVPMMYQGKADLKDKDGKCVAGYNATIDTAVDGLAEEVIKQLAGK